MLEERLRISSESLQQASHLPEMNSEQEQSLNVSTTSDEGVSVDILSTDAFRPTSENEVGYFGTLHFPINAVGMLFC